jgi:D-alanyl-D-alanine dipeptidase
MASNSDLVDLQQLIPNIQVDLKYATADNITGHPIYTFDHAYLRKGPALKLRAAEAEAEQTGYRLKVWDAYCPLSAQFALWNADPNPDCIADPYKTYSYHNRGEAVDVTLTDMQGNEIPMPSQFDASTKKATRNWSDDPPTLAANAQLLQKIVQDNGLTGIPTEWWHFQDDSVQSRSRL